MVLDDSIEIPTVELAKYNETLGVRRSSYRRRRTVANVT